MTARRLPRMSMPLRETRIGRYASTSWTERVLHGLGAHPSFADAVLGDLIEECTRRRTQDGANAARWWYAREAFRSAPHLLWNAMLHGGPLGRARAGIVLAALALLPLAVIAALNFRDGPPARLVIGTGSATDGIIVNSVRPVQLRTLALDAAGHVLRDTGVRFQRASGAALAVSPRGVVTCTESGDATVRAALGGVATSVLLRCRPVRDVRAPAMLDIVVGDPAEDVPFEAIDADGRPVTLLTGRFTVGDSTIVSLAGQRIRGRAAGSTWVMATFGDHASFTSVHVYERVATPERVRAGEHVAVPVRLASGEMRQWRIPAGDYFLAMLPAGDEEARPRLAVVDASCTQALGHLLCAARHEVSVIAYYPQDVSQTRVLRGTLAVWRQEHP